MNLIRLLPPTLFLLLSACTSSPSAPERVPSRSELIGEFWMGDGLGVCQGIDLRDDGTYKATLCGGEHMGLGSTYRSGRWHLEGNHIFFFNKYGQPNAPETRLSYAETFYYKRNPAFTKAEDLNKGRVHEWWVFEKKTLAK